MAKSYEWSLIPYPYFRTFNIFTAFLLNALCVGIISTFANETHSYFVYLEAKKYNFQKLQEQNNVAGLKYNSQDDVSTNSIGEYDPYNFHTALYRIIRVTLVSTLISFFVYVLLYFIFGFGGGMVSQKRQYRFFSSIPG